MSKTYIAETPNFINRCIQKEIDDEKQNLKELKLSNWKPDFLFLYQKADLKDDTGETYYRLGMYKSLGGFVIRGEDDLAEVIKFLEHKSELKSLNVQIINCDDFNEAN